MRVFNHSQDAADLELPDDSFIKEMKYLNKDREQHDNGKLAHKGPKMLVCITMYQETWSQVLQSVGGCIRAILELERESPDEYAAE